MAMRPRSTCRACACAGIGGDMVRADVLQLFADTLGGGRFQVCRLPAELRHGGDDAGHFLRRCRCSLSVSTTIDRHALKTEARAVPAKGEAARSFVVCGKPLPDHVVEIRNELGQPLGDRRVGRIFVKGAEPDGGLLSQCRKPPPRRWAAMDSSTPATWATGSMARSSSPAAPRT